MNNFCPVIPCQCKEKGAYNGSQYKDRKAATKALKPVYEAVDADAALAALEEFERSELGQRNPATVATWRSAWDRFTPFLQFPPMLRRVIYTTNSIESLNYQLRKGVC